MACPSHWPWSAWDLHIYLRLIQRRKAPQGVAPEGGARDNRTQEPPGVIDPESGRDHDCDRDCDHQWVAVLKPSKLKEIMSTIGKALTAHCNQMHWSHWRMVGMVGSVPLHLHSLRVNGGLEAVLSRPTALSRALIRTHENHASTEEEKDQQ